MTEHYKKDLVEAFLCGLPVQNRCNALNRTLHNGYGIICNGRKTVSSNFLSLAAPLTKLWATQSRFGSVGQQRCLAVLSTRRLARTAYPATRSTAHPLVALMVRPK